MNPGLLLDDHNTLYKSSVDFVNSKAPPGSSTSGISSSVRSLKNIASEEVAGFSLWAGRNPRKQRAHRKSAG